MRGHRRNTSRPSEYMVVLLRTTSKFKPSCRTTRHHAYSSLARFDALGADMSGHVRAPLVRRYGRRVRRPRLERLSLETRAGEEDGASQATPRGFVLRAAHAPSAMATCRTGVDGRPVSRADVWSPVW